MRSCGSGCRRSATAVKPQRSNPERSIATGHASTRNAPRVSFFTSKLMPHVESRTYTLVGEPKSLGHVQHTGQCCNCTFLTLFVCNSQVPLCLRCTYGCHLASQSLCGHCLLRHLGHMRDSYLWPSFLSRPLSK